LWWNQRKLLGNFKSGFANKLGYRSGSESGCVVFDAEGASGAVKTETTDSIDIFNIRKRKSDVLCGRRGISIQNFHRGHMGMIARRELGAVQQSKES